MAVTPRDIALKAPNMKAQGNALGHATPLIQALQGRYHTNPIRNLRPMERGAFCHALAGLGESVRFQTLGVALGYHILGFQPTRTASTGIGTHYKRRGSNEIYFLSVFFTDC